MSDNHKNGSWWKTLPGIISAITGLVTAVAGLVIALNEAGIFQQESVVITSEPQVVSSQEDSRPSTANNANPTVIAGITLPAYVVLQSAFKTKREAQQQLVALGHQGYRQTGFFWIPDFEFLSGAEFYQVYIGPFSNRDQAIGAVCRYNQKTGEVTYGVRLSTQPGREEIRCGD